MSVRHEESGGGGARARFPLFLFLNFCPAIRQSRSFSRRFLPRLDTEGKALLIRVYRRESVVQFPRLRPAELGFLRILESNQSKCLSINHLCIKPSLSNRGQSRLIKVNQGKKSCFMSLHGNKWLVHTAAGRHPRQWFSFSIHSRRGPGTS